MNGSFVSAVRLVSAREIQARVRSKAFIVSALILVVMVVASIVVAGVVATPRPTTGRRWRSPRASACRPPTVST